MKGTKSQKHNEIGGGNEPFAAPPHAGIGSGRRTACGSCRPPRRSYPNAPCEMQRRATHEGGHQRNLASSPYAAVILEGTREAGYFFRASSNFFCSSTVQTSSAALLAAGVDSAPFFGGICKSNRDEMGTPYTRILLPKTTGTIQRGHL